jgi:uncharacterized membrane protein/mono/diheme cytochrome c family protein
MFNASLIGNLHPAIVHLPIGILVLAGLLEWLMLFRRFRSGAPLIPLITAIGALTAILACITGLLLESSGEYDGDAVTRHKWSGLITALIASTYFVARRKGGLLGMFPNRARLGSLVMLASVTITGHWGGDLTHGSGFLWKGMYPTGKDGSESDGSTFRPVADVLQAKAYQDLVGQVMTTKCVSCHGPSKQKGGLRLDDQSQILKGGKNGIVITPGFAANSELLKRLLLPPEDEHHMPPKEKPQLSLQDRTLIEWWISKGADFNKTVKEIGIDDSTLSILRIYQGEQITASHTYEPLVPEENVPDADPALLEKLRTQGVVILPIDPAKGYLMANLINVSRPVDSILIDMQPLSDQLIWLKLSGSDLTDTGCKQISGFRRLIRLQVDQTRITDAGLAEFSKLISLERLNLAGDSITFQGLVHLKAMKSLSTLNIWNTRISNEDMPEVFSLLSSAKIDTGGYKLPFLDTDTMIMKDTRKK